MERKIFKTKTIENQKKIYLILIGLAVLSFAFGLFFIFVIDKENLTEINRSIISFFEEKKWNEVNIITSFFNVFLYILIIWILGISIIGLPISLLIFMFKAFLAGFSISSIIYSFGFKGLLYILIEYFPSGIIYAIVLILVSFYSTQFSYKLFNYLFLKKMVNFKDVMHKYIKIFLISSICSIFLALYNFYVIPILLNLI